MRGPCAKFMEDDSCPYGKDVCHDDHHHNVDPGTHETRTHQNYMIPNVQNDACQRCIMNFRQCDKVGRGPGPNDPCSACRHFGGENCNSCVLEQVNTYNSHAWDQFTGRPGFGYTLAAKKPIDEWNTPKSARAKPRPKPLPMKDHLVVAGWHGLSKVELLALPDFLPAGVRDCPRAYCVPPGPTTKWIKSNSYLAAKADMDARRNKRKRDEDDDDDAGRSTSARGAYSRRP